MATHRRNSAGHVDPFAQRRLRYQAVLAQLKAWDFFRLLPRAGQEALWRAKNHDPVLVFDDNFPADAEHLKLRRELEKAFREAKVDVGPFSLTVRDYYAIIGSLEAVCRSPANRRTLPRDMVMFMEALSPVLSEMYPRFSDAAWLALHSAVVVPLVGRSQLDRQIFQATLHADRSEDDKLKVRMAVHCYAPQVKQISLDGDIRSMYRVGTGNEWNSVVWLDWNPQQIDRTGNTRPVYIQSHALRNLHSRVNLPTMAPYLEYWLYQSLAQPNIVERQGDDLLVEFRVRESRLGYLVVTPLADVIAVRTFLFLTMQNTPEGRRLEKRLHLTRREINWLGLHELAAFTQTDLKCDPELCALLDACGCGHLLDLHDADFAPQPKAFAEEMRKYLRMAA